MITVENALSTTGLSTARVIAGETGLANEVSFVTVMDVPRIVNWLHGGEMLLAASLFEQNCTESFLRKLKEKLVAAVVTKPAFTRRMSDELTALCDEIELPIIVVDEKASWRDIMDPIFSLTAKQNHDETWRIRQMNIVIMKGTIDGDSLSEACEKMRDIANLNLAVLNEHMELKGQATSFPWAKAVEGLSDQSAIPHKNMTTSAFSKKGRSGLIFQNAFLSAQGRHILLFPIEHRDENFGYVALLKKESVDRVRVDESIAIEELGLMAALEKTHQREARNVEQRYSNLILDQALYESNAVKQRELLERQAGDCRVHDSYRVALASVEETDHDPLSHNRHVLSLFQSIHDNREVFRDTMCFERSDNLVFFMPMEYVYMPSAISVLQAICCREMHASQTFIGVSGETSPVLDFFSAYTQAQQALRYSITHPSTHGRCFYENLGILRLFMDKRGDVNTEFLFELRKRYLEPVRDYDKANDTELERTLATFVGENKNRQAVSSKLHIHRNTLYQRMSQIEKLLDCSLNDSDDMLNIELALKVDYFLTPSDENDRFASRTI